MSKFSKFSPVSFDWPLATAVFLLIALGLAAIYSVDLSRGAGLLFFKKQLLAVLIGGGLFVWAATRQHTFFRSAAKAAYFLSLFLLALVLFLGQTLRGTTGWFVIGGFSFQPVEFAKVGVVLILGYAVASFGRRYERPLFFWGTLALAAVPAGLTLLQPDLGSALLLMAAWFGVMLLLGARRSQVIILLLAAVTVSAVAWLFVLQDYQRERLLTFVNSARDPLGAGYNVSQSIIAVGSGQWVGRGLGFGSQSQLRFLPEAQTDFIFAVIGEELGLAGALVLLALYVFFLWRLLALALGCGDDFIAAALAGMAILFFVQIVVNIGANVGILPVTGVPLPFVSYGGSSLMMSLFLVGIAESMVVKKY